MPHSDISGSKPACGSPKLFAVDRVLLRLLAPRHPPYALIILTFSPLTFPPRAPRSVVISAFHHKKRLTLVFSSLYAVFKEQSASWPGGDERVRTAGLLLARQALSQLSYTPSFLTRGESPPPLHLVVGLAGLEPATSRLSGVRSNHLSYRPEPRFLLQGLWELNSTTFQIDLEIIRASSSKRPYLLLSAQGISPSVSLPGCSP